MTAELEDRLQTLKERGVVIVDPRQTYVDSDVDLERICKGAILYPGTRLTGARVFVGPEAKVGSEGPAILENSILAERAEVASGFLSGAVLLRDARAGSNAHIRAGTLLEEEASIAHAVGLKNTVLLSYVTLGSLINFCDGLISGGTSRRDHSEVGSGFIHFNFSPWGQHGDKATPSLVGDVVRGVFLREDRIFLGGASGMVGPQQVGFGSITAAGQMIRKAVAENHLVSEAMPNINKVTTPNRTDPPGRRKKLNIEYIGQLLALKAWYESVRLQRIPSTKEFDHLRIVTAEAINNLDICIQERINRLRSFLLERVAGTPSVEFNIKPCPLQINNIQPFVEHTDWVKSVPDSFIEESQHWLKAIVSSVTISFEENCAEK